jgi:hypothetical protein
MRKVSPLHRLPSLNKLRGTVWLSLSGQLLTWRRLFSSSVSAHVCVSPTSRTGWAHSSARRNETTNNFYWLKEAHHERPSPALASAQRHANHTDTTTRRFVTRYINITITILDTGVGVGVLLAADSQSTSAVWVSGLPLGPLTRFLSCSSFFVWQLLFSSFEGDFSDEKTGL